MLQGHVWSNVLGSLGLITAFSTNLNIPTGTFVFSQNICWTRHQVHHLYLRASNVEFFWDPPTNMTKNTGQAKVGPIKKYVDLPKKVKLNNIHSTDPRSALTSGASFFVSRPVPLQLLGGCWGRGRGSRGRAGPSFEVELRRLSGRAGTLPPADGLGTSQGLSGGLLKAFKMGAALIQDA